MLIIKSQYGGIIPVSAPNYIYVGNLEPNTVVVYDPYKNKELINLGEYESEERAKEVMEMIEEHIRNKYSNEQFNLLFNESVPKIDSISDLMGEAGDKLATFVRKTEERAIFVMPKE